MIRIFAVLIVCFAGAVQAQTLRFPSNANLQREVIAPIESYALPVGIWEEGALPLRSVEGRKTQQAWRIAAESLTTLQLLRPLREQLRNARYRVIFECQTEACGGFDFRFAAETLPPPEMQINIGDFRFLAAERLGENGPEFISLFVSKTAQAGFVQVTQVAPLDDEDAPLAVAETPPLRGGAVPEGDIVEQLQNAGRAVLPDLTFATGSAQLAPARYASLQAVADYLLANPNRTVALVGHTDAAGGLASNIALSKRRAASVLERLATDYGVPRRQLEADGVGYLSPVASNLTDAGREANRRVEVVATATTD